MRTCSQCGSHTFGLCPTCGAARLGTSAAMVALGLTLTGCDGKAVALYGVAVTDDTMQSTDDADGDGFSAATGDCDDDNAAIHPDAVETPGDGVDANCDGEDDT